MTTAGVSTSSLSVANKRQLVADLLRKKAADTITLAPLTVAQQVILYLQRACPESLAYNVVLAHRLTGCVDAEALRSALQRIVDRHAILRTTYVTNEGEVVQRIQGARDVDFKNVETRGISMEELESRWLADGSQLYNLETDSSLRVRLYSRSAEEHVFVIVVHHIAFDYWSYDVLCRELQEFYAANIEQRPANVTPLKIQFADYARAQKQMLAGPRGKQLWEHWNKELSGGIPVVNLPVDFRRSLNYSSAAKVHSFELSEQMVARLRTMAQARHTTVYVLFLAALQVLLHRYTGEDDVVVGSPLACRNSEEVEDLIGYFTNMVPLRANLSGDPKFSSFVEQVKQTLLGAIEHQEFPLAVLLEKLGFKPDASRPSIFDVGFAWEAPHTRASDSGRQPLNLELLCARHLAAPYDITVQAFERDNRISVVLSYKGELFEAATIERFARHLCLLLEGILTNPDARVSMLPLVGSDERLQLIEEWNRTETSYPREASIQQLFEDVVERHPNRVAVQFGCESLTYAELNARANQLAWYLQAQGVDPRSLVGICIEGSVDMVVGLLAIAKCGAAYVPLDPNYPAERIAFMLQDTAVSVLVTHEAQAGSVVPFARRIVCLDRDRDAIGRENRNNPPKMSGSEDLAYVMYTSGSTGTPKGIQIPQRAITRLVRSTNYISLGPDDVIAQGSNISFDAATFEIWGAFLNGARLVVVPKHIILSPAKLAAEIAEQGITTIFLTTALFNELAAHAPDVFRNFKNVLFGGEAVEPKHVRRVLRQGPPKRLIHVYGPTETTTFATWHFVQEVPEEATTVPIGAPLANTTAYVLDANRQLVPVGVPGELYIGGDGVAHGYWKREELTEERFVPDPFSERRNARLYRSGDLVRRRGDGAIEFLGRIDQQVKIRGFRIELNEIAATLRRHEQVKDALVVVIAEGGDKRLVMYVELRDSRHPVSTSELRAYLKQRLPDYMIPSAFVVLDRFPINANGKIERRALPSPSSEETREAPYADPESDLERTIASIWQRILNLDRIGRYDNFFDLGGHSLLVARVHQEIQRVTGKPLAVVDIFRFPTVSSIAAYLNQCADEESSMDDVRERARQQRLAKARRAVVQAPKGRTHDEC